MSIFRPTGTNIKDHFSVRKTGAKMKELGVQISLVPWTHDQQKYPNARNFFFLVALHPILSRGLEIQIMF